MSCDSGSITGRITIGGKPAPNLEVYLLERRHYIREKAIATTTTAEDGRYLFAELPSGHYWLKVHALGYVNAAKWDEDGPGRNVSVADEAVENADLDLILGGVITGRVTDSEGNPVVEELVELTMLDKFGPPDETLDLPGEAGDFLTDSNGAYRIYGIPPGRYVVSIGVDVAKLTGETRDRLRLDSSRGLVDGDRYFQQTFCPGVSHRAQARVIDISAGTELHYLNIKVGKAFRSYAVSGRVVNAESGEPIAECRVPLGHYVGRGYTSSRNFGDETDQNGNFSVTGLVPGLFSLCGQLVGETELYCEPVTFEIKEHDLQGLEIKAVRGVSLSGSVAVEGASREEVATKLDQLKLQASFSRGDGAGEVREALLDSEQRFTIHGLRPGRVRVSLGFGEASKYFSMVRIEYSDAGGEIRVLPSPTRWNPRDTPSIPLGEDGLKGMRIVLRFHNGSITGHVNITGGKLDSSTRLWVPISCHKEGGDRWSTSMMEVDPNGNFFMDGLEPGEYAISIADGMGDLSETKRVLVNKDSETVVSFEIDLSRKREEEPPPRPFRQLVTNALD